MLNSRIYKTTILLVVLLFSIISFSYAIDDDFGSAGKLESEYFTIYYAPQLDLSSLTQQLNIQVTDKLLAGKSIDKKDSPGAVLADMVDTLFLLVCDILDMPLYSFHGKIKICQDRKHLNRIYKRLFDKDLNQEKSFYVYSFNTIYMSSDDFKREILGHEMGHAVISHFFVVHPSVKIHEILSTYVEYQLRQFGQQE